MLIWFWFPPLCLPVELCLTSNVKGNTVPCYSKHHFKYWYELGHPAVLCVSFHCMLLSLCFFSPQYTFLLWSLPAGGRGFCAQSCGPEISISTSVGANWWRCKNELSDQSEAWVYLHIQIIFDLFNITSHFYGSIYIKEGKGWVAFKIFAYKSNNDASISFLLSIKTKP